MVFITEIIFFYWKYLVCLGRKKNLAFLFLAYFSICLVYGSMKLVFSLESLHVVGFCNQCMLEMGGKMIPLHDVQNVLSQIILDDPFNKNLIFGGYLTDRER